MEEEVAPPSQAEEAPPQRAPVDKPSSDERKPSKHSSSKLVNHLLIRRKVKRVQVVIRRRRLRSVSITVLSRHIYGPHRPAFV